VGRKVWEEGSDGKKKVAEKMSRIKDEAGKTKQGKIRKLMNRVERKEQEKERKCKAAYPVEGKEWEERDLEGGSTGKK
jgi:hypothetical protein